MKETTGGGYAPRGGKGDAGPLKVKSYAFAIRMVKLSQFLRNEKSDTVLYRQVIRSGTAVGALLHEAEFGQSRADFKSKIKIALKEANETGYWLSLLRDTDYIDEKLYLSLAADCKELIAMLVSTVNTLERDQQ